MSEYISSISGLSAEGDGQPDRWGKLICAILARTGVFYSADCHDS